jgi:hypothetical protein
MGQITSHVHKGDIECHVELPLHLQQNIPSFAIWFEAHVKAQLTMGARIDDDNMRLSQALVHKAYTYKSMWTYENHYCVDPEIRPMHLTFVSHTDTTMCGSLNF